jgi:hypothetical protein
MTTIYTREGIYQKHLRMIEEIKEKLNDKEYLDLMNNIRDIKEKENRILDKIYRLIVYQVEIVSPPQTNYLIPNIVKNEIIGINISDEAIEHIQDHYKDTVSAKTLRRLGFKVPPYMGYTIECRGMGFTKVKNDLIYIDKLQTPVMVIPNVEYEDIDERIPSPPPIQLQPYIDLAVSLGMGRE